MNLSKDLRKFREECDNGSSYWFSDDHRDCGSAFKGQAVVPAIAALILRFSPVEIMGFIAEGIKTTTSNGILFIFSVIYFGVLADTGLFDVIVGWLVKKAGNNVIAVTVATAVIATIAHLDGTTAVTVLITIPSMYPVYKKMKIDPRILLCLTGACMGVMNLLPLPALDGGRLVFLIIEAIRRKPVNRQIEGMVHFAGLMVLMLLMVVVMYNDILKIF